MGIILGLIALFGFVYLSVYGVCRWIGWWNSGDSAGAAMEVAVRTTEIVVDVVSHGLH